MDAAVNAGHPLAPARTAALTTLWCARVATTVVVALSCCGLMLVVRRLEGSLTRSLEIGPLLMVALVLTIASGGFRAAWRAATGQRLSLAWFSAPLPMLVLWAAGVLPTSGGPAGGIFLAFLAAAEAGSWWERHWAGRELAAQVISAPPVAISPAPEVIVVDEEALDDELTDEGDEGVCQRITRRLDEQSDVLEGWVRVPFLAGQRHATAHVAICPAMSATPECEAEPADGPAFTLKVGQLLPIGVRFEIKLDEPAEEPTSVVVAFALSAPAEQS